MPLLIDFKSGDKMIINGAVLENAGGSTKLLVHNRANILRGREVLSEEDAHTPASRVYFALQCAYIFADHTKDYYQQFHKLLAEYVSACSSAKPIAEQIEASVADGKIYKALKETHKLIAHERELLKNLNKDLEEFTQTLAEEGVEEGAPEDRT